MPQRYSKIPFGVPIPWWAFEIAIWVGLAASAAGLWYGLRLYRRRRSWTSVALTAVCGFVLAVLVYGSFIEPNLITVGRFEVGAGSRSVTVAFLTDLHLGYYKGEAWGRRVVARTNALGADVILLGGDYIMDGGRDVQLLDSLKKLHAPLGVYASMGNHDGFYLGERGTAAALETAGIPLLVNDSVRLPGGLAVAAVDDDWYGDTDFSKTLSGLDPKDALILVVHNPEVAVRGQPEMSRLPALALSGHTHGGQIRLPLVGSLMAMPHGLGPSVDRGLFTFGGVPMIVSQGLGESGPRARLFCPPEITLVTLRY